MLHHSINYSHYFQLHTDLSIGPAAARLFSQPAAAAAAAAYTAVPCTPRRISLVTFQHADCALAEPLCTTPSPLNPHPLQTAPAHTVQPAAVELLSLSTATAGNDARPLARKFTRSPFDTRLIHAE